MCQPRVEIGEEILFPSFTNEQLSSYVRPKLPGSSSRLKRGLIFFNSHKIVTLRSYQPHTEVDVLWVGAYVQRSFGNTERPAYVKFVRGQAIGGHCSCKIGKSGLCGHIIAILYNLKRKTETGHFKLFLSVASQLQTWHKKGKRRDLHMDPINKYKIKKTILEKQSKTKIRNMPMKVQTIAQ